MDLTDEALVKRFQNTKDSTHFKSLVRRYQNRIFNAAHKVLGNKEEAEEVVQETYIKVHQNLHKFQEQASFAAWIFRIAHNICIDILRAKKRRGGFQVLALDPQSSWGEGDYEGGSSKVVSQVADKGLSPEQEAAFKEQIEMIGKSLGELPEAQRMVIVLHDIEGFSYQEISEIVGANLGTVRSRLHYGRQKLRELLDPYFSPPGMTPAPR